MSNKLKIYKQYDHENDTEYSEARLSVPCVNSCFLLEPPVCSAPNMSFNAYGDTDKSAVDNLIEILESNAKALQVIADSLKK